MFFSTQKRHLQNQKSVVLEAYFSSEVLEYLAMQISNRPRPDPQTDMTRQIVRLFLCLLNFTASTTGINLHFPCSICCCKYKKHIRKMQFNLSKLLQKQISVKSF